MGRVRYSSSERVVDPTREAVSVELDPTDLVVRRTALFGMSRTGKSNTTKVIANSVFRLRDLDAARGRVSQHIFDVNGEYANENTQGGSGKNAACLKNVAAHIGQARKDDVATYGLARHPADPDRKIVKINIFGGEPTSWHNADQLRTILEPLLVGKRMADEVLTPNTSLYVRNFRNTPIEVLEVLDGSAATRFARWIPAEPDVPTSCDHGEEARPPAPVSETGPVARITEAGRMLSLLYREQSATLAELVAATDWLPHTTRAALTGLRKKGHAIARDKRGEETCYRIAEAA